MGPIGPLRPARRWGRPAGAKELSFGRRFIVRSARRTLSQLEAVLASCESPSGVRAALTDEEFRASVWFSSESAAQELDRLARQHDRDSPIMERVADMGMSYLLRACSRPTPFGMHGVWGVGSFASASRAGARDTSPRRWIRLDHRILQELHKRAMESHHECEESIWYANPTLYRLGPVWRYLWLTDDGGAYVLSQISDSSAISSAIRSSRRGAEYRNILSAIERKIGWEPRDRGQASSRQLLDALIARHLLVAATLPSVVELPSDTEQIDRIVPTLGAQAKEAEVASTDAQCREIAENIAIELKGDGVELGRSPVWVDLIDESEASCLGPQVQSELKRATVLLQCMPRNNGMADELRDFATRFEDRFGDASVPLMKALDPEFGIEFQHRERSQGDSPRRALEVSSTNSFIESLAWRGSPDEAIEIDAETLTRGGRPPIELPSTFELHAAISAESASAIDRGQFTLLIRGLGGPVSFATAARMAPRDSRVWAMCEEAARLETRFREGVIVAEIVHVPEGRNVTCRPSVREFEIPLGGVAPRGVAPRSQVYQILPADLDVMIVDGEVLLWSRSHQRFVLPRLSCADNYVRSRVPVYRFLGGLEDQYGARSFGWNWGNLQRSVFLPRVVSKRSIFSLAQWQISAGAEGNRSPIERRDISYRLRELRDVYGLPRVVRMLDGDRGFLIDIQEDVCQRLIARQVGRAGRAVLVEAFPQHDKAASISRERYVHELIFHGYVSRQESERRPVSYAPRPRPRNRSDRGWIQVKIYLPSSLADAAIANLFPALAGGSDDDTTPDWFFVRYGDPDRHLRLRLRVPLMRLGEYAERLEETLEEWNSDLNLKTLWSSYRGEVSRFGGRVGLRKAEKIFCADSRAIAAYLDGEGDRHRAERLAIASMLGAGLIRNLELTPKRTSIWLHRYAKELKTGRISGDVRTVERASRSLYEQIGDHLWEYTMDNASPFITATNGYRDEGSTSRSSIDLGRQWDSVLDLWDGLLELIRIGRASVDPMYLAGLLLHLHVNRLFESSAARNEFIVVDVLRRLWSRAARG